MIRPFSVRLSCFVNIRNCAASRAYFKLGWHSCDLALCSLTVYPPWTGHWWGPFVWMKTDSKICVSSDVSVWSEERAGSLFLCEGNLRSLLGKPADLWEQLTCLEKFLLLQGSGVCVCLSHCILPAPHAVQCTDRCSGVRSGFWGSDKVCI